MWSNIPSAHQGPGSSSRASWRCPGKRSRSLTFNEKKQPCHASPLKKRDWALAMPLFHVCKNWVAGFNPEKYARHWGSSSQGEPAQSKCTSTCHNSCFMRKFTGKMPLHRTAPHTLYEPAQSKCTSTCHKSHFIWKFTGKVLTKSGKCFLGSRLKTLWIHLTRKNVLIKPGSGCYPWHTAATPGLPTQSSPNPKCSGRWTCRISTITKSCLGHNS